VAELSERVKPVLSDSLIILTKHAQAKGQFPRTRMLKWIVLKGEFFHMDWGWLLLRSAILISIVTLLYLSQRFWYRGLWRVTSNWGRTWLRVAARLIYVAALLVVVGAAAGGLRSNQNHFLRHSSLVSGMAGLWFASALFAYVSVKSVHGLDRGWRWMGRRRARRSSADKAAPVVAAAGPAPDVLVNPSRRYFFQTATVAAGAMPFLGAVYGFAGERLRYQVRRVEVPITNLPSALDGLRIAQLSDIHLSGYMTRENVRRAVDMANDLSAELAVVTGDFITGVNDPLADCVDELRRLHAPLGTWGCNGNHEIYARAEDAAQTLFAQAGMKLLRQESKELTWRGAKFNLIGVDYQRERSPKGRKMQMIEGLDPLVRRDMPNILLSHNPNSFRRAAELGVELTLSGHTHGGQVQVEILDRRFSPARFITDYIAGLFHRPLFAPSEPGMGERHIALNLQPGIANLYVNRGLGTVGAPVRLGVPPEITLLTLRRS